MNIGHTLDPINGLLTGPCLKAILSRVAFRDWSFRVLQGGAEGFMIQPVFFAPDSRDGGEREQHGRKWYVSRHATTSEIIQTALAAVLAAVEHEAREDFLVDGKSVFHPHHDIEDLLLIANRTAARPPLAGGAP